MQGIVLSPKFLRDGLLPTLMCEPGFVLACEKVVDK